MKPEKRPVLIWDLPLRVFHWLLMMLVIFSYVTHYFSWIKLHFISGYSILGLLLFRLIWGLIGSDTARFTKFLRNPVSAIRYLIHFTAKEPDTEIGHNAAGGWMVIIMLCLLLFQVGTGLASNDDIASEGPLAKYAGKDLSDYLTALHATAFKFVELAVLIHVLAITAYAVVKRRNLVLPMISGRKLLPVGIPAPKMQNTIIAVIIFTVIAVSIWLLILKL